MWKKVKDGSNLEKVSQVHLAGRSDLFSDIIQPPFSAQNTIWSDTEAEC
jgi:hypothetical protein